MSSVSRARSLSSQFQPIVNLDNLETLQDRWAMQCDGLREPPAPPQLNSPRSLTACERCGMSPSKDLEKLSLGQHLVRILGHPSVEARVAALADAVDTRAAMQVAVLAFQRAAIGLGTAKEKLVAYDAFDAQERLRVPRLAAAREVRRQLMTDEANDRHRRRSNAEGGPDWSGHSVSHHTTGSGLGSWTSHPGSPPVGGQGERTDGPGLGRTPDADWTARRRRSGCRSPSPTTPETGFYPSPCVDGHLPYVPRDAASLSGTLFGNRTFTGPVSNPSCTPLARRAARGEHVLSGAHDTSRGAKGGAPHPPPPSPPSLSSRPLARRPRSAVPAPPAPAAHERTSESLSMEKISPGGRNDLSIVSISSSQLDRMLTSSDAHSGTAARDGGPSAPPSAPEAAPVTMFHEGGGKSAAGQTLAELGRGGAPASLTGPASEAKPAGNRTSALPRIASAAGVRKASDSRPVPSAQRSTGDDAKPTKTARDVVSTTTESTQAPAAGLVSEAHRPLVASRPQPPATAARGIGEPFVLFCANPVPLCGV